MSIEEWIYMCLENAHDADYRDSIEKLRIDTKDMSLDEVRAYAVSAYYKVQAQRKLVYDLIEDINNEVIF